MKDLEGYHKLQVTKLQMQNSGLLGRVKCFSIYLERNVGQQVG